jgi:hypothetical protein
MRTLIPIVTAAALTIVSAATPVLAQGYPPPPGTIYVPPPVRPLPRVEITPRVRTQYYRDCFDAVVVEQRLTGPTVVPRSRCHWVKRYYAY